MCTPGTRRENAIGTNAVRIPGPLCLCRVFQLLSPSELRTFRWHQTKGAGNAREPRRGRTLSLPHLGLYSWPKAMPYNDHRDWRRLPRRQLGYKFGHFEGWPARAGRLDLARVSRLQMSSCRTRKHATRAGLTLTDRIQLCGSFRSLPTPALSIVPEIVFASDGAQTLWTWPDLQTGQTSEGRCLVYRQPCGPYILGQKGKAWSVWRICNKTNPKSFVAQ